MVTDLLDGAGAVPTTMLGALAMAFVAGAALGSMHFGLLWWNARLWAGRGTALPVSLHAARFAILAAGLAGLSYFGAGALLAGAAGLFLARHLVVRRIGGMP